MKFKVGDRVKVYDVCQITHRSTEDTGIVKDIEDDGIILVKMDTWGTDPHNAYYFHPKQCRRLIKKPKFNYTVNGITVNTIVESVKPNPVFFSKLANPKEFPKLKSVNCFHPKIANFVVNVLKWFNNVGIK